MLMGESKKRPICSSHFMQESRPAALLTLVRHAESMANVDRVLQGVCDAPLSPRGLKQLQQLEDAWRPTSASLNLFDLPKPTLIVTSPIGRAKRTSCAIARGCGINTLPESDTTTFRSAHCEAPQHVAHDTVRADAGLSERHFGTAECTRKMQPVQGYERPPSKELGRAESVTAFYKRAADVGVKWVDWLETYARHNLQDRGSPDSDHQNKAPDTIPHLVLVSHGQWINAFLQQHLPDTWEKADLYYIQSANTSLFTIGLHVTPTSRRLELLRRNDTRHLDETTRPSKRGRRAKPPQRTTLTALWS